MEILLHALDRLADLVIHAYHKAVPSKAELETLENIVRTRLAYNKAVEASSDISVERRRSARYELAQALHPLDIEAAGAEAGVESAKAAVASIATECEQNINKIRWWQLRRRRAARSQLRAVSDQLSIANENMLEYGTTLQQSAMRCIGATMILKYGLAASVADAASHCDDAASADPTRAETGEMAAPAAADLARETCK